MDSMKPLLKWVGGKTQILEEVLRKFPRSIQDYYEPFVGGGSVLLGVLSEKDIVVHGKVYASDVNPSLINFYNTLKTYPEHLIVCMEVLQNEYKDSEDKEQFYYKIRDMFNSMNNRGIEHAATFLFLNRTCFRGVYREGPRGFNVPFGHYKSTDVLDKEHIHKISNLIQRVEFRCQDFDSAIQNTKKDDFIYADPPYVPETATSFVGYVANGFDAHEKLFEQLKNTPTKFLMSNSDVPLVRMSFEHPFVIETIQVRRAIHSKDPSVKTNEVLITNISTHQDT